MILSKDLQKILEGVHFFLAEALQRENLSGRAECFRVGLVLQLEGLAAVYPTLRIQPSQPGGVGGAGVARGPGSSTSLPYLPMNQSGTTAPAIPSTSTAAYSSSSSGVNSSGNSSSGSSGDGLVGGGGGGVRLSAGSLTTTTTTVKENSVADEEFEEMYEEFDEFTEDEIGESKPAQGGGRIGGGGGGGGKEDEEDGVYTETDEPIPFSSLIASCERHGPLGKRTKGLLRQVKTYQCVATGGCLYLYLKDSDDRQRKTIDLTGYIARAATGEEIKDARKRDAAFEMVCPGKKTHTFIARTARDKNDWLTALSRTIRSGRTRPSITTPATPSTDTARAHSPMPPPPSKPAQPPQVAEEYKYYHDVAEESQELEEVEPEDPPRIGGPPPPRPPPPNRPPLPQHLQPGGAGGEAGDGEDSDDGIYCEIEDDVLEAARQTSNGIYWGTDILAGVGAGPALTPPRPPQHHTTPATPPQNSHVGMLSEEVFSKLSSFTPQPHTTPAPPRLPPKGVMPPVPDDSEYKVPMGANMEYQVPPTPVQIDPSKGKPSPGTDQLCGKGATDVSKGGMRNGNENGMGQVSGTTGKGGGTGGKEEGVGVISGPLIPQGNPSQAPSAEILPIKPSLERRASVKEEKKGCVSSFLKKGDGGGDAASAGPPMRSTSNTVKDMIARLNQNKQQATTTTATTPPTTTTTTTTTTAPATDVSALPKQHLRPEKPSTPPRPLHLQGDSPQPPAQRSEKVEEEKVVEVEDDDELYAELADVSGGDQKEIEGELYVAKFAFVATLPQALSFGRGDELAVYDRTGDSGWWRASLRGKTGLVPREYLKKKE